MAEPGSRGVLRGGAGSRADQGTGSSPQGHGARRPLPTPGDQPHLRGSSARPPGVGRPTRCRASHPVRNQRRPRCTGADRAHRGPCGDPDRQGGRSPGDLDCSHDERCRLHRVVRVNRRRGGCSAASPLGVGFRARRRVVNDPAPTRRGGRPASSDVCRRSVRECRGVDDPSDDAAIASAAALAAGADLLAERHLPGQGRPWLPGARGALRVRRTCQVPQTVPTRTGCRRGRHRREAPRRADP